MGFVQIPDIEADHESLENQIDWKEYEEEKGQDVETDEEVCDADAICDEEDQYLEPNNFCIEFCWDF